MPRPSILAIAQRLTLEDLQRLIILKSEGPKIKRLEAKRDKIAGQLAAVEKQIADLSGGAAPKQGGRKPGHPAKAAGKPGRKPGRPAKVQAKPAAKKAAKGKPGRKPAPKPAPKPTAKKRSSPAVLERMAKMRAAKAAKRTAAARG